MEGFEARLSAVEQTVTSLQIATAVSSDIATSSDGALWALEGRPSRAPQGGAVVCTGTVVLPTDGTVQWQYAFPAAAVFEQDWSEQAAAMTALGHPVRSLILRRVLRGKNTVETLVEFLDTGTSGQIHHRLKELTTTGWLVSDRRAVYEVPPARIAPLLAILVAAGAPE